MKEACSRLCEHGDVAADPDNDPAAYDGAFCWCSRCPNFEACGNWTPLPLCEDCRRSYGVELRASGSRVCPVCSDSEAQLYFHPSCKAHAFCGACLDGIYHARPDQPLPSEYGLERDCGCEDEPAAWGTHECDSCARALRDWEDTPDGQAWSEACMDMEDETAPSLACPLCRAA